MITTDIRPRILISLAGHSIAEDLAAYLQGSGLSTILVQPEELHENLKKVGSYDIAILGGTIELIKLARSIDKDIPLIFISKIQKPGYAIKVFNAGADDCLVSPLNFSELLCRISIILKRCDIKIRRIQDTYALGPFVFNVAAKTLATGQDTLQLISLTEKETKILSLLCAYKNEVLPKEILLKHLWGNTNYYNRRSLDVYICRLRNYLADSPDIKLETVTRVGYTLKY